MSEQAHFKDEGLNRLANEGHNIAQFVSYDNEGNQRHSRVIGLQPNAIFKDAADAAEYLIANTTEHQVNVRSYHPYEPESKPLVMRLKTVDDVTATLRARQNEGLHTLVNETIDERDGGVSGVVLGDLVEFTPDATPRGVEDSGTVQFTRSMGANVIRQVYHFAPNFGTDPTERREFTVTPLKRGVLDDHTIIWEVRNVGEIPEAEADTRWPNNFSRMLGDKVFGLLMADQLGLQVPHTQVISRRIAPFDFGTPTETAEYWMRTAPNNQTPGLYTTTHGWVDPYEIMAREDPTGENIGSIISQESVKALYSGACIMGADGNLIINGKKGYGDDFMVGDAGTAKLPSYVENAVRSTYKSASNQIGPVRFEWAYDGVHLWVVQLHRGESASYGNTIFPGDESTEYIRFKTHDDNGQSRINDLRDLIKNYQQGMGIVLEGNVGVTSHLGDLLRKAQIPSYIEKPAEE